MMSFRVCACSKLVFFFSSRRRHTRCDCDWSSDVCSSDLDVRWVAMEAKALLEEMGLRGRPKTSGSRGMHVNARIQQRWSFTEVRRAALAFSREIERRAPTLASSKWWKE